MLAGVLDQIPYRTFYERRGGVQLGIGEVAVGGIRVEETTYGWNDRARFPSR